MIETYKEFKEFLNTLDHKPKLLLHACCAPCSSHCLNVLKDYFDITIYFSNDNIYPAEEYFKRLDEINKFADEYGKIPVVETGYHTEDYYNAVKGLEHLGEKTERCYHCYELRMEKTIQEAKKLGFEYYTTTLSLSPFKISRWVNEIGYNLEEKYGVKYLFSDFKKEEGYKDSLEMSQKYGLYRQNYCGCEFSYQERMEACDRTKEKNQG